jgi:hypothetical protein
MLSTRGRKKELEIKMNPSKMANCCVLGDGSGSEDHAHVSVGTPMKLKKKEYAEDPMYRTTQKPKDMSSREKKVTAARRGGAVRPLDGGVAS